jgi:hypothetical protein
LAVTAAGGTVRLTADRCDVLGCLAWELELQPTKNTSDGLRTWADRIADRVTGLLEPLKVHEVDESLHQAQLRSDNPSLRGEKLSYYEVVLHGTARAVVRRYQVFRQSNGRREQVNFALTHEALAKLVADLTANR